MSVLALEIAGVRIDLEIHGADPIGLARYRPFAGAAGSSSWTIELLADPFEPAGAPGRCVLEREGRWRIAGAEDAGWLDPAGGAGAVRCDPGFLLLDTFIRSAVGARVLSRGGLLVHGAALVVDGAAHLFPARSGSGKSTLAARAGHPLADEISAVVEPGPDGFLVHATPWWICARRRCAAGLRLRARLGRRGIDAAAAHRGPPAGDQPGAPARHAGEPGAGAGRRRGRGGGRPVRAPGVQPDSDVDRLLRGP